MTEDPRATPIEVFTTVISICWEEPEGWHLNDLDSFQECLNIDLPYSVTVRRDGNTIHVTFTQPPGRPNVAYLSIQATRWYCFLIQEETA